MSRVLRAILSPALLRRPHPRREGSSVHEDARQQHEQLRQRCEQVRLRVQAQHEQVTRSIRASREQTERARRVVAQVRAYRSALTAPGAPRGPAR